MSLAASLGTTLTVFSAPAFLLAGDLLMRQGGHALHVFDITPVGLVIVATGVIYVLVMRWLIPRRTGADDQSYLRLEQYYTELLIEAESPWIGKPLSEMCATFSADLQVVDRLRGGERVTPRDSPVQAGDVLLVHASGDEISSVKDEPGFALNAIAKYGDETDTEEGARELVQVVVGPRSEFAGRTVADIDFHRTLGVVVVGLWRKQSYIVKELSNVRLEEGDVMVLAGSPHRLADLRQHHGVLMMVPFAARQRWRHRAPLAIAIMLAVVALAALDWFPTPLVFLAGAVAMVLGGCVSVEQAYAEIDVRIYVMIAGVIPLGTAMEQTGTAKLLADPLLSVASGWPVLALLALMFGVAALLTQILSDSATTVLIGPIAVAIAAALGLDPTPFVICAALGAVASFLTPIGHHGNLLILNPGRYTFGDFIRVGLPLTILLCVVSAWVTRALWLDGPWLPGTTG